MTFPDGVLDYGTVVTLGLLAGVGELLTRYRDAPGVVLRRPAGVTYLAVNGLAGAVALYAVRAIDLRAAGTPGLTGDGWGQVLVAGFSAMALLRSSLFTLRVGDRDVPIGPAAALKGILDVLDRAVDREQAVRRDQFLDALPAEWTPDTPSLRAVVTYSLGLMQNVTADEQKALGPQIDLLINDRGLSDRQRFRLACLQLLPLVGGDVLVRAIARVRQDQVGAPVPEVVPDPPPAPPPP